MKSLALTGTVLWLLLVLPGCSSEAVKRSAYDAAYQKQCMDRTGVPDCDPQHKSYDEYRKSREVLQKQGP